MAQGLARVFNGTAFLPAKPWYKQEKILELKAGETHRSLAEKQTCLAGFVAIGTSLARHTRISRFQPQRLLNQVVVSQLQGGWGRRIRAQGHRWLHMSLRPA